MSEYYIFAGWNISRADFVKATGNITFKAVWMPGKTTVKTINGFKRFIIRNNKLESGVTTLLI